MGPVAGARHGDRRHLGRCQLGAGAWGANRGLVDRSRDMALVIYHHGCGRVYLGRSLVGACIDPREDALAAGTRAAADFSRARCRRRAAEPWRGWLSRADPLPGDVGAVRFAGLSRLFSLLVYDVAAELPCRRLVASRW